MSDQGRLIINARGETAKAIGAGNSVFLQVQVLADRSVAIQNSVCNEIVLTKRDCAALALQMLDAAGYAAEVREFGPLAKSLGAPSHIVHVTGPSRAAGCYGDAAIDACDTQDICKRWGCRKQPMRGEATKPEALARGAAIENLDLGDEQRGNISKQKRVDPLPDIDSETERLSEFHKDNFKSML